MTPIFDRDSRLVGWFDGANVFDPLMDWVAFVNDANVFSSHTRDWLGPLNEGTFVDTTGKATFWLKGATPKGTLTPVAPVAPVRPLTPLKPLKPLQPLKPLKPLAPLGGWSAFDWNGWLQR